MVLTGSGTQALQLAMRLAGDAAVSATECVALPAYSCYDVISAAVGAGVRVTFYDIDPETLSPEEDSLRAAVSGGAKAIVAGNLYGFPVDWSLLRRIAEPSGALLIEDAAQGLGCTWDGVECGGLGDLSVLSFGRGKGWTGGAGGALLVRARPGVEAVNGAHSMVRDLTEPGVGDSARAFVVSLALWALGRPSIYGLPASIPGLKLGETVYKPPGAVSSIPGFAAAAALGGAEPSRAAAAARRTRAQAWDRLLDRPEDAVWRPCRPLGGGEAGYIRYPLVMGSSERREALLQRAGAAGVAPGYPRVLSELKASQRIHVGGNRSTTGAALLAQSLVTLPTHSRVHESDLTTVSNALAEQPD